MSTRVIQKVACQHCQRMTIIPSDILTAMLDEAFAEGAREQRAADEAYVKRGVRFDMQPLVTPPAPEVQ